MVVKTNDISYLEQQGGLELDLDLDVSLLLIVKAFLSGIEELKK